MGCASCSSASANALEAGQHSRRPRSAPPSDTAGSERILLRRRRKLTIDEARTAIEIIRELPAVIDHEAAAIAFTRLVDLASEHELTVCDAAYIELAARRRLPLASNDARMKQAAIRSGVDLWQDDVSDK